MVAGFLRFTTQDSRFGLQETSRRLLALKQGSDYPLVSNYCLEPT